MIIYKIEDKTNGKIYIGQTKQSLEKRIYGHIHSGSKIGRAIQEKGSENFVITIIDTTDNEQELNEKERLWIAKYQSNIYGYNTLIGGTPTEEEYKKLAKYQTTRKKRHKKAFINRKRAEYEEKIKTEIEKYYMRHNCIPTMDKIFRKSYVIQEIAYKVYSDIISKINFREIVKKAEMMRKEITKEEKRENNTVVNANLTVFELEKFAKDIKQRYCSKQSYSNTQQISVLQKRDKT